MTRVSLDLESTLADIATPFLDEYERRNSSRPNQWTDWGFGDADFTFREFMEITSSNWKHRAHQIPPTEKGLMMKINKLHSKADVVDIVTGRQGFSEIMQAWLNTHGIKFDNFRVVESQEQKSELGYDLLIDDCPKHAVEVNDDQTLYLYDQPYNRDVRLGDNCKRVASFRDVLLYQ